MNSALIFEFIFIPASFIFPGIHIPSKNMIFRVCPILLVYNP